MKRILSMVGVFAVTCVLGIGLSGLVAENAGACLDCSGWYQCTFAYECQSLPTFTVHSPCEDGCCQEPNPAVVFECNGRCYGTNHPCNCIKVGCWEGLEHIPIG